MIDRKVSIRYARALNALCEDKDLNHKEMLESVKAFHDITKNNANLNEFLKMSIIPVDKKIAIIDKLFSQDNEGGVKQFLKQNIIDRIFSDNITIFSKKFIEYVIRKNRYVLLGDILEIFEEIVNERENILKAEVVSALELDEETKSELKANLERKFNKSIDFKFDIDDSLIAGIVVQIDDVVYDGSVSTYLNNLERKLLRLPL
jgi:F-type H+-transporting ATPase subunit delta